MKELINNLINLFKNEENKNLKRQVAILESIINKQSKHIKGEDMEIYYISESKNKEFDL